MSEFHFLRPWWLLALVPAAVVWWRLWARQSADRGWRTLIDPHLLPHLLVGAEGRRRVRPIHGLAAAWLVGVVAAAGPAWEREPAPFADDTTVVVIVLKVTPSMSAVGVQPPRRPVRAGGRHEQHLLRLADVRRHGRHPRRPADGRGVLQDVQGLPPEPAGGELQHRPDGGGAAAQPGGPFPVTADGPGAVTGPTCRPSHREFDVMRARTVPAAGALVGPATFPANDRPPGRVQARLAK